eukprot:TRINITY_DN833_c2_g1_i2.p1 TRINITY_DN833_c2_g1~~TRINITY_DN833_c2_g1_i2.p1  ORF type:complete len:749 (+),score=155.05 TRINITY_DN833_c2_g1_i2:153-2249(+)
MSETPGGPEPSGPQCDVVEVRHHAKKKLMQILERARADSTYMLFSRRDIIELFSSFLSLQELREAGVGKFFDLLPAPYIEKPESGSLALIYVIHDQDERALKDFVAHYRSHELSGLDKSAEYHLLIFPARSATMEQILEQECLFGTVTIHILPLLLVAIDQDLLTMDLRHSFRSCYLHRDPAIEWSVAHAIDLLERLYGRIPVIVGKGDLGFAVCAAVKERRHALDSSLERPSNTQFVSSDSLAKLVDAASNNASASPIHSKAGDTAALAAIDKMVIVDRSVDLLTPLLTQFTYEGALDEVVGIRLNTLKVEKNILFGERSRQAQRVKIDFLTIPLTSSDPLFCSIRDLNFGVLCPYIAARRQRTLQTLESVDDAETISQLRKLMSAMRVMEQENRTLPAHDHLVERLSKELSDEHRLRLHDLELRYVAGDAPTLEELLACMERPTSAGRALALAGIHSLTRGMTQEEVDEVEAKVLSEFGWRYALAIPRMVESGLLRVCESQAALQSAQRAYARTSNKFNLITKCEYSNPADISYAYNDYAPLSVRIASLFCSDAWKGKLQYLKELPGDEFELRDEDAVMESNWWLNLLPSGSASAASTTTPSSGSPPGASTAASPAKGLVSASSSSSLWQRRSSIPTRRPTIAVVFIGGVTRAEISAIRWAAQHKLRADVRIITTDIITGPNLCHNVATVEPINPS